ncbi:MAG: sulfate adenylyltransferase, partial [Nocardioidaceae bacterium]|nr:sulfate adenylyltransferase [Nocardioidaceae bacterium]
MPVTDRPPQHSPGQRELDDLELLLHGAAGPVPRFEGPGGLLTLTVPTTVAEQADAAGRLELVDPEGAPLATVTIEATYPTAGGVGLEGPVTPLQPNQYGAFRRLYLSPAEARARVGDRALTVPVTGPLTTADITDLGLAAAGRPILLVALAGHGTPSYAGRGLSGTGLIRATLAAASLLPGTTVAAVALASRGPGRAEDDEELRRRVLAAYAPGEIVEVTGNGGLPDPVAGVIAFEQPAATRAGLVLFFTGLSGSGKSTLARALHDLILERGDRTVTSLDGDVVRRNLSAGLTFSKADRETNIRRIGWVAAEIGRHRGVAICSPIAPFDATRKQVRAMVEEAGGAFFLIHVATPVEECERRDRKGLYAKARRGEIPEFTG